MPRSKLPADIAAVIPVPQDRRSIFVVPWPDDDDVYLGTTDTAWQGPLDDPACLPDDVDYLLGAANGATTSQLTRHDVTGVWAGLRPLLAPTGGHRVSERTADLSRRHTVRESAPGLVTVTGGKLTTYRRMAEDTVDVVVRTLGPAAPARSKRSPTRRLGIVAPPVWRRCAVPGRRPTPGSTRPPSPPWWPATATRRRRSWPWRPTDPISSSPWWSDCPTYGWRRSGRPARRWP